MRERVTKDMSSRLRLYSGLTALKRLSAPILFSTGAIHIQRPQSQGTIGELIIRPSPIYMYYFKVANAHLVYIFWLRHCCLLIRFHLSVENT